MFSFPDYSATLSNSLPGAGSAPISACCIFAIEHLDIVGELDDHHISIHYHHHHFS